MSDARSKTLSALLTRGTRFEPEYKRGLSNHLPMTLIALAELGADDARLAAFFEQYSAKLEPKRPSQLRLNTSNWRDHLGEHAHASAYAAFFEAEYARLGERELLQHYLPLLMPGVGGGAFHPLIRLSYALHAQHKPEVIEALAAWAVAYLELEKEPAERATTSAPEAVARLQQFHGSGPSFRFPGCNIFQRMERVAQLEGFAALTAGPDSLSEIAALCLDLFRSTMDFTALHAVTSAHAMRAALPYFKSPRRAIGHYWVALSAAYLTIGAPSLKPASKGTALPSWEEIAQAALPSKDEHVIKYVHTAHEEWKHYGNEDYRRTAAEKSGYRA